MTKLLALALLSALAAPASADFGQDVQEAAAAAARSGQDIRPAATTPPPPLDGARTAPASASRGKLACVVLVSPREPGALTGRIQHPLQTLIIDLDAAKAGQEFATPLTSPLFRGDLWVRARFTRLKDGSDEPGSLYLQLDHVMTVKRRKLLMASGTAQAPLIREEQTFGTDVFSGHGRLGLARVMCVVRPKAPGA